MPERDGYIAGVPCWIDTTQPDPDAAASFYGGLFGWELENVMPAGESAKYLIARIRGGDVAAIASQWEGAPPEAVWNTYIWVDDADESATKARAAGGNLENSLIPQVDSSQPGNSRYTGLHSSQPAASSGANSRRLPRYSANSIVSTP